MEIANFKANDMKELAELVKRVDELLDELVDETAVLKQFEWPAKYYVFREAKSLYEELELMKKNFNDWNKKCKTTSDELKAIQKYMVLHHFNYYLKILINIINRRK